MTINPVTLQSLESDLGAHKAVRQCTPVNFYMLLAGAGYLDSSVQAGQFCRELDSDLHKTGGANWSRPALTKRLRQKYGAKIVSWQFGWPPPNDYQKMFQTGYIATDEEMHFLQQQIEGKSVKKIVQAGFPVMVTMKPGFGTDQNKNIHSVIIADWQGEDVVVIDPDSRNPKANFSAERVNEFLAPMGAGTIVLPKPAA